VTGGWTIQELGFEEPEEPEESTPRGVSPDRALSVAEFYGRLRMALRQAFPAELWVTGEIRKVKESSGHRYIELADVDRDGDEPGRQAQCLEVACWSRDWPAVAARLREAGISLEPGLVVRMRGRASIWEGAGKLRFTLTDIDIEALLGGIAAARARLLRALEIEGLLDANRSIPLPLVPLRIGLVTSAGSEAYRDFTGQLGRSSFAFEVFLEPSLVQGPSAPRQIAAALRRLERLSPDVVVIVRGGGGRGDLAAFDSEIVARAIASAPFPVWTGIGHTGDRSVADEVAAKSLITPSACGESLVDRVSAYWEGVVWRSRLLAARVGGHLDRQSARLEASAGRASRATGHQLARRSDSLRSRSSRVLRSAESVVDRSRPALVMRSTALAAAARHRLSVEERHVQTGVEVLRAYDPTRQFARGWTLTRDEAGLLVRSVVTIVPGTRITTRFVDGVAASVVEEVREVSASPAKDGGGGRSDRWRQQRTDRR
jgi:exodeoxyribonuclease VII large subunit